MFKGAALSNVITATGLRHILILIAAALLLSQMARVIALLVDQDRRALIFPYSLDYGEGALLDQSLRLARFEPIYRTDLSTPPYIVSNYPPLYPAIQVPFVWAFGPAYWYGRLISILSSFAAALSIGLLLYRLTADKLAGLTGGLLFLAFPYVVFWSPLDRIDTLALTLSLLGLLAVVFWGQSHKGIIAGAVLFTAATYTRQSSLFVAPLSAFVWLWSARLRRNAVELAVIAAALNLGLFIVLDWQTSGGFYFNIVTANLNEFDWRKVLSSFMEVVLEMPLLIACAVLAVVVGAYHLRRRRPDRAWWVFVPYFAGAIVTAGMVGKIGSNVNYFYELAVALCLAAGVVVALTHPYGWLPILLVGLALQVGVMVNVSAARYMFNTSKLLKPEAELAGIVRVTPGIVLADEFIGLIPLTGRELYIQPFAQKQLADAGLWDQTPFVESIRQKKFTAILLFRNIRQDRWTAEMLSAIESSYRVDRTVENTDIYLPRQ